MLMLFRVKHMKTPWKASFFLFLVTLVLTSSLYLDVIRYTKEAFQNVIHILSNNYIIYLYNLTLMYRSYVLLYAGPIYPYIQVLYTLICRSYILWYADPIYPYMPALYTLICRAYILIYTLICQPLYSYVSVLQYSYMPEGPGWLNELGSWII